MGTSSISQILVTTDELVKASDTDPSAGKLDDKVDGTSIQVASEKAEVVPGGVDHDSLLNTHDLTTDIDHDQLTNFTSNEHFTMLDEDNMSSDSNTQAATQQSIKAYVDTEVSGAGGDGLSNVLFSWVGATNATTNENGLYVGTSLTADPDAVDQVYLYHINDRTIEREMFSSKFTKISSISTITIYGNLWSANAIYNAVLTVTTNSQSATATSTTTSPAWYAGSSTIDVSGFSDGTTYDVTISLKNTTNAQNAYCGGVILIGS